MQRLIALIFFITGYIATQPGCSLSSAPIDGDRVLTVFAAASLADAFMEIAQQFEKANPDVDVILNFAGSQQLAHQISQGAPADVFASADERQMDAVISTDRILVGSSQTFARNRLIVVFPANNPVRLTQLDELANPGKQIVLAAPEVPAGQYSLVFLEQAAADPSLGPAFEQGVLDNVASYEENVRVVLSKVELGEADAGIVYRSDIIQPDPPNVGQIEIPATLNVEAVYPIAPVHDSGRPQLAGQFIDYVLSKEGQDILARYGFDKAARTE